MDHQLDQAGDEVVVERQHEIAVDLHEPAGALLRQPPPMSRGGHLGPLEGRRRGRFRGGFDAPLADR